MNISCGLSYCKSKKFDRKSNKCLKCKNSLIYQCEKCVDWFTKGKLKSHEPCNDIICDQCTLSFPKLKYKKHSPCFIGKQKKSKKTSSTKNKFNIEKWLSNFGMKQYSKSFVDEGFDTKETLGFITNKNLTKMNVKTGHKKLLMFEIKKLKKDTSSNKPTPIKKKKKMKNKVKIKQKKKKSNEDVIKDYVYDVDDLF